MPPNQRTEDTRGRDYESRHQPELNQPSRHGIHDQLGVTLFTDPGETHKQPAAAVQERLFNRSVVVFANGCRMGTCGELMTLL
jgi:hypothetical protein